MTTTFRKLEASKAMDDAAREYAIACVKVREEARKAQNKPGEPTENDLRFLLGISQHCDVLLTRFEAALNAFEALHAPTLTPPGDHVFLKCNGCNTQFDVTKYDPGSKVRCGRCSNVLNVPEKVTK